MRVAGDLEREGFLAWLDKYQAQLVVLAAQISWSESVETALVAMSSAKPNNVEASGDASMTPLQLCLASVERMLTVLADSVLYE
ncbi:unnamed protein product, partial [Protopolystoma xenopodis]